MTEILRKLTNNGWFTENGAYVLFDGQYGSTGKGLLASFLAEHMGEYIDTVATNAGPNSGHTGYYQGEKILTQQIPVASIVLDRMGEPHEVYLNGGAVIDPPQLRKELQMYKKPHNRSFTIHPHAPVIREEHKGEQLSRIASTGKGVGFAMADKVNRMDGAVFSSLQSSFSDVKTDIIKDQNRLGHCFVETAQGWSLGLNSGFYPYTTSRECSVAQAMSDLGFGPRFFKKSIVSLRTYPIRVGNTPDGYSGDVYPDQEELDFDQLGVEPERTTVTQRVRRVFTWSWLQFKEMLTANEPDALFINFMNYLPQNRQEGFIVELKDAYFKVLGRTPDFILAGYGPYNTDVKLVA